VGAQYLIRIDDFCPTMNWRIWAEVEQLLLDFRIRPIVAVVPDNRDPNLMVCEANPSFWEEVRLWQSRGWSVGLHGYQHTYVTRDSGIVGINQFSEFSGSPYDEQSRKLRHALQIFQREGVTADIWVAPGHSFDHTTVRALSDLGINYISDGFFPLPGFDSFNVMWIPQQFWRFRNMPFGVWTVCLHLNRWSPNNVAQLRSQLERFADSITDCQSVATIYKDRRRRLSDNFYAILHTRVLRLRKSLLTQEMA